MIVGLAGTLVQMGESWVILRLGGVDIHVNVPTSTLSSLGGVGSEVRLYTHLHVREDILALYGFAYKEELELFRLLISVPGIGPRTGLSMLSTMSPRDIAGAILNENTAALTRTPGVGKKIASRLVLELKGKLTGTWLETATAGITESSTDVLAALTALGYSVAESNRAIASIPSDNNLPLEEKVKLALQQLAR